MNYSILKDIIREVKKLKENYARYEKCKDEINENDIKLKELENNKNVILKEIKMLKNKNESLQKYMDSICIRKSIELNSYSISEYEIHQDQAKTWDYVCSPDSDSDSDSDLD